MRVRLSEVCKIVPGFAFKSSDFNHGYSRAIKIKDIISSGVDTENCDTVDISRHDHTKLEKFSVSSGDFVFAMTGATIGKIGRITELHDGNTTYINQRVAKFEPSIDALNKDYLFYLLSSRTYYQYIITHIDSESAQANISATSMGGFTFELMPLHAQEQIAKVLLAIDDKIQYNNRTNDNLYKIGQTLYKEKFESSSQAKMQKLGFFFPVVTGKKDANAAVENGKYPFFTCSKQISAIDEYSFNESAILLAGNGDFNVKFYRGKFDAYQRTYVLIPKDASLLGYLYWAISLNLKNITSNFRGSVIKFITKGNIEDFEIPFIDDRETIYQLQKCLEKIESNNYENIYLAHLRDTLLPELMNGKIDLSKVEI